MKIVRTIAGLWGLIVFNSFNNFLGGVFFALMDAYGLTLVSVQVWGLLWGFLSLGIICGGIFIARKGLGTQSRRTLFRVNFVIWMTCVFFTIQPSLVLLTIDVFIWMFSFPFIEAVEQTVLKKVVPLGNASGACSDLRTASSSRHRRYPPLQRSASR